MREWPCRQTPSGAPLDPPGDRSLSAALPEVQRQPEDPATTEHGPNTTRARRSDRLGEATSRSAGPPRRRFTGSAETWQPTHVSRGLLTTEEAADYLHLSPWTLRHWVLDERIRCVRLGRLVRFRLADLEAFIDGRPNTKAKVA
jgi:excisionase family DNA binding protein